VLLTALLVSLFALSRLTAQAMLQVRQAGQAVDTLAQARELHAPLTRLLAYAQLVYQGDRTFHEALTQQIQLVEQGFTQLEQQVAVMAPAQWSLLKQAQADWVDTRAALQELLPANDLAMERRLNLREALRSRSSSLQRALEGLERESQAQRVTLTARASRWSGWVDRAAALLMVCWLMAGLALWWVFSRRLLGPLEQVAAAAQALAQGDLSFRMQRRAGEGAEPLVASFNAMAESLQRSQERLTPPREVVRS
jgi:methyl-accepting chemotaxis protein